MGQITFSEKGMENLRKTGKIVGKIPWTKERKDAQRLRMIGKPSARRGKKVSEETRKRISEANYKRFADRTRHPRWKGGISKIDRTIRGMKEYKEWRSAVFARDSWTCQTCGFRGGYVTAHHIKAFSKILREYNVKTTRDALRCGELWTISNGVTLCEECHALTDNYRAKARNNKNQNVSS